jgi:ribonuclease HI
MTIMCKGVKMSVKNNIQFEIYADGSCLGNPGPGGWAVLIKESGKRDRELSGHSGVMTTNQQMELTAAIKALEAIPGG